MHFERGLSISERDVYIKIPGLKTDKDFKKWFTNDNVNKLKVGIRIGWISFPKIKRMYKTLSYCNLSISSYFGCTRFNQVS